MQGPIRPTTSRGMRQNANAIGSLFALSAPDGYAFDQGATGTALVDQRPKRHLAIIQNVYGSGSGASGSGVNRTGKQVAADMLNAYYAVFAQWVNEDDTFVAVEMPSQPNVLAIEANGVEDVPDGAVVELLPGPGQPDFYYFFWTGEVGTGSGNGQTMTIDCGDGNTHTVTIDGNVITVGD